MSEYVIRGGFPLAGEIGVSGAKNGALPLLFASVVADGACTYYHVPDIGDVRLALRILSEMGARVTRHDAHTVTVNARYLSPEAIPRHLTAGMRASSYLLGACLGRFGYAAEPLTGGCDFGNRPLNCHYGVFHALGAVGEGELHAPPGGLRGGTYDFPQVSVGATVNGIFAACRTHGVTHLHHCATESHVGDLIRFLNLLGADIRGGGTPDLVIRGRSDLGHTSFVVSPDEIEAGTYLLAGVASGGDVTVTGIRPCDLSALTNVLVRTGCLVDSAPDRVRVRRGENFRGVAVETAPAPGFPTDLHPPTVAALCFAAGKSQMTERVWQERFRYTSELAKMGAVFSREGQTLTVHPASLHAASVTATDLRGGAALAVAALGIAGKTHMTGCELIERGYEDFTGKLRRLGADVSVLPVMSSCASGAGEESAEERQEKDGGDAGAPHGDGEG